AFLAYIGFVPLLMVIDATPEKTFEDRFWGFFKAIFVLIWRFITLQFIWRFHRKPWLYRRQIISHNAQVFRYAYTTFVIWNLGTCYWLMMTAFGADDFSETLINLVAGLVANLVNPFLMTIPIYLYTQVRKSILRNWAPLALVFFWLAFEWLHLNWDLSWSWITLGHSMTLFPSAIQYTEITGTLGISLQIMLVNVLLFILLKSLRDRKNLLTTISAGSILVLVALPFILNIWLLNPNRPFFQSDRSINVRVIQPNIDPYLKTKQSAYSRQIQIMDSLIRQPGIDTIDLVITPETSIPKEIFRECLRQTELIEPLWQTVYLQHLSILCGFTEVRHYPEDAPNIPNSAREFRPRYNRFFQSCQDFPQGYYEYCNASFLLRVDTIPQTFQKAKLVPMVERTPFLDKLIFLKDFKLDLADNLGSYGLPDSIKLMVTDKGVKVGSLVCYESEYGDYTRQFVQEGADMFSIITNDGWWQKSSGHIQHAHFATLRSIESRRAIARSANTGISLFADEKGNIFQATEYGVADFEDRQIPLFSGETFYVRHGDFIGKIAFWLGLIMLIFAWADQIRTRFKPDNLTNSPAHSAESEALE
ncbi:MAG: apolipoprotein N-acyltransferase, partial [Bacteroidota bacterium]